MSVRRYLDTFQGHNARRKEPKRQAVITVRMKPELHDQFAEVADQEKVSLNGLANALFQDYVDKKLQKSA